MNRLKLYQKLKVRVQLIRDSPTMPEVVIKNANDLYLILKDEVKKWDREKFLSVMLNAQNQIIGIDEVSVGSLTATVVHPREVFKSAILANAAAIILVHNHPSGNLNPFKEDKEVTEKIKKAAEILNINFLDHIIITKNGYTSLSEIING